MVLFCLIYLRGLFLFSQIWKKTKPRNHTCDSLRASSPIWASETSLARTRERAAKPRGAEERPSAPRSRVLARLATLAQIGELARRLYL